MYNIVYKENYLKPRAFVKYESTMERQTFSHPIIRYFLVMYFILAINSKELLMHETYKIAERLSFRRMYVARYNDVTKKSRCPRLKK